MADDGHRCEARTHLQFDHIVPVAHGGESTVANVRLRCRAHNQYAAEQEFGRDFMRWKREQAAERDAARRRARTPAPAPTPDEDVVPWLRQLGFRAELARAAAAACEHMRGATLEERVKAALRYFRPRGTTVTPAPA